MGGVVSDDHVNGPVQQGGIFDVGDMYLLAGDSYVLYLAGANLAHMECDLRAGLALHLIGTFSRRQTYGCMAVYFKDFISALKTATGRGRIRVRLVDHHRHLLRRLVDDCAYAAVCLAYHHLEILILLLRHIDGVGIQSLEHGIDAGGVHPLYGKGIHIAAVKFLQDGSMHLDRLAEFE